MGEVPRPMIPVSWLETAGAVLGVAYVILVIRQKVACWPVGIASAALYMVVFFHARLYGQVALQGVYVALMVYGWREWLHGGGSGGQLAVSRLPSALRLPVLAAGVMATVAFGVALARTTDAALPYWDAGTLSFSLLAQWMTARKWIETWLLWIAVDVVYVGMYASQELYPTVLLYVAFLVLAVLGYRGWRASERPPGPEVA